MAREHVEQGMGVEDDESTWADLFRQANDFCMGARGAGASDENPGGCGLSEIG
jgi:hypothetical protein